MEREIKEGEGVIEQIKSEIEEYMSHNEMMDYGELAEHLYNKHYRRIDAGMVACKGEMYIITPELEDKVFKLLNQ